MSTSAQISANQANAQLSTGPTTEAGKAASSQNNFRHGLRGAFKVLAHEDPQQFAELSDGLYAEHQPVTYTETALVETMIQAEWRSRRVQQFLDDYTQKADYDPKIFAIWLRYETTARRSFHKCLADILRLKAERRRDQIGFERQKIATAAEARKLQVVEARIRLQTSQIAARELANQVKMARLAQLSTEAAANSAPDSALAADLTANAPQTAR